MLTHLKTGSHGKFFWTEWMTGEGGGLLNPMALCPFTFIFPFTKWICVCQNHCKVPKHVFNSRVSIVNLITLEGFRFRSNSHLFPPHHRFTKHFLKHTRTWRLFSRRRGMRYGAKIENQARDIFDHYRTPLVEVCDNQLFIKLITHHTQPTSYPTQLIPNPPQ